MKKRLCAIPMLALFALVFGIYAQHAALLGNPRFYEQAGGNR